MDKSRQNKYEQLFEQLLQQLDIRLIKYGESAYRLSAHSSIIDEKKVYQHTEDVINDIELILQHEFIMDLKNEARDCGITSLQPKENWEEVLACIESYKTEGSSEEYKFAKDHQWEIDVLDMICHHFYEVDLDSIPSTQGETQVFYVAVQETYTKTVRVLAQNPEQAAEIAYDALTRGDIDCSEYLDDSILVRLKSKEEVEAYYDESISGLPLFNEQGEEE